MPETTAGQPDMSGKPGKLTPAQFHRKVALLEHRLSTGAVAREAGVSRQTAWMALMDKTTSANVRATFERLTGKSWDPPPVPEAGADGAADEAEESALALRP